MNDSADINKIENKSCDEVAISDDLPSVTIGSFLSKRDPNSATNGILAREHVLLILDNKNFNGMGR